LAIGNKDLQEYGLRRFSASSKGRVCFALTSLTLKTAIESTSENLFIKTYGEGGHNKGLAKYLPLSAHSYLVRRYF